SLHINWGLNAEDEEQADFTIAQTTIHPSWWECPLCQDPILAPGSAADIAVIQITQDTPQIPEAQVDLAPVAPGTQVVKVGWGCEQRTNIDANPLQPGRYTTEDASTLPAGAISQHNPHLPNRQLSAASDAYLFT